MAYVVVVNKNSLRGSNYNLPGGSITRHRECYNASMDSTGPLAGGKYKYSLSCHVTLAYYHVPPSSVGLIEHTELV